MSVSAQPQTALRRVLFVDDDQLFLETVRELMSVLSNGEWEVLAAETPTQAFGILQTQAVDLVVVDVQMGVMDGIQMLSLLNRGYPNVQKVVLTGHASDKYRAACLSSGAELFLEKPTNPTGWQSLYGVLHECIKHRPEEGFQGVLRRVGLQDVIQMECLARSSSVLEVSNPRASGEIYIETGQIIHAQLGAATGEDAFNQLLGLTGGQFNLKPFTEPPTRSINGQWEFLLMEAARKTDEARETQAAQPVPETPNQPAVPVADMTAEVAQILAAAAERTELSNPAGGPPPSMPGAPAPYQFIPALPPGVSWRPRVEELLLLSPQGEVVYEWQCAHPEVWVSFFEFASQRGQRLAQTLPLGSFERLEILSGATRAVVIITTEQGVMVRTRREAV